MSDLWRTVSQVRYYIFKVFSDRFYNISVWKKGQQEKKEQAAKKKASKKDVDAVTETGESKASAQEPEVIEID